MYTGLTGKVKIGVGNATDVAYISNWSVENSVELIEFAELGEPTRHKKAGMQNWTASADGTVVFGGDNGKCHRNLFNAMQNGQEVYCEFYLDNGEKSNRPVSFSGRGLIESMSIDLSSEDKGNVSISISGVGELTLNEGN